MAFPQFAASNAVTLITTDETDHDIALPASVPADNLIVVHWFWLGSDTGGTWDQSSHGTWTQRHDTLNSLTFIKKADGTEGGGTLNNTLSGAGEGVAIAYSIFDWEGQISLVGTVSTQGNSTAPDGGALVPPGFPTTFDYLMASALMTQDSEPDTGLPTGESEHIAYQGSGTESVDGVGMMISTKDHNGLLYNPDAYTLANAVIWVVTFLLVQPGSDGMQSSSGPSFVRHRHRKVRTVV